MAAPRPRIFGLLTMVAQQGLRRKSLCVATSGQLAAPPHECRAPDPRRITALRRGGDVIGIAVLAAAQTLCNVTAENWCSTPDLIFIGGNTKFPWPPPAASASSHAGDTFSATISGFVT
jgi:hypothetical protein